MNATSVAPAYFAYDTMVAVVLARVYKDELFYTFLITLLGIHDERHIITYQNDYKIPS